MAAAAAAAPVPPPSLMSLPGTTGPSLSQSRGQGSISDPPQSSGTSGDMDVVQDNYTLTQPGPSFSETRSALNRVPTLSFPPLHLGSFDGLDSSSFPSPPSTGNSFRQGTSVSSASGGYGTGGGTAAGGSRLNGNGIGTGGGSPLLGPGTSADRRPGSRGSGSVSVGAASTELGGASSARGVFGTTTTATGSSRSEATLQPRDGGGGGGGGSQYTFTAGSNEYGPTSSRALAPTRSRESSRSSIIGSGSLRHQRVGPPTLPPPSMSLPPLPSLPPISPLGFGASASGVPSGGGLGAFGTASNGAIDTFRAPRSPAGSLRNRPSAANLAINIPPASQFLDGDKEGSGSSAILKDSPGIPRRRTLVQTPSSQGAEARRSVMLDDVPHIPAIPATQDGQARRNTDERMDEIAGQTAQMALQPQSQFQPQANDRMSNGEVHRLEKKQSTNDLRASPTSPTAKRSLPRPPSDRPSLEIVTAPPPRGNASLNPGGNALSLTHSRSQLPPVSTQPLQPSRTENQPSENIASRSNRAVSGSAANGNANANTAQHRPTNSASALPVIAGLADAGPYSFNKPAQAQVGLGRPPAISTMRQEEVCLECMMRDKDLADVDVTTDGVWERASDAGLEDLKWREEAILRSMGSLRAPHDTAGATSMTSDDESSGPSPPSTNNSVEEAEARRKDAAKKRRATARARKREIDWRIVKEIGWRGFKWEEGSAGEGIPRGFRGTKGGKLTEEGIKAVMTKFPSASAHRYNSLQTYLRHQYLLVMDIAAEASRIGFYPAPSETGFPSRSSHEGALAGGSGYASRTGPVAGSWEHRTPVAMRQSSMPLASATTAQGSGYNTPTTTAAASPSLVRPSPSSPADLSAIASSRINKAAPLSRPLTHFIPEREHVGRGVGAGMTSARAASPASPSSRDALRLRPVITNLSTSPMDRYGAGAGTGNSINLNDRGEQMDHSPISPADSGMRPFSFAVRAGAVANGSGQGSDGHGTAGGRRSFFGRWGGSVTSFFGGSQGGSGSMMDMHLGLENDRRNRTSSFNVHSQPRAVSLASPTRPSFFSGDSRDSTAIDRERAYAQERRHREQQQQQQQYSDRSGKSLSTSRLSQVLQTERELPRDSYPGDERNGDARVRAHDQPQADANHESHGKKKGLKGLLKKMKPRKKSVSHTPPAMSYDQFAKDSLPSPASYTRGGPGGRSPNVQHNPNAPPHARGHGPGAPLYRPSASHQPHAQMQAQSQHQSMQGGSGADYGTQQLAPPPPLSYLVGRGEGKHRRDRSGSSSSMLTDNSGQPYGGIQPSGQQQQGSTRSVSAPMPGQMQMGDTSSGDISASPTSSRFEPGSGRERMQRDRDSYASVRKSGYGALAIDEEGEKTYASAGPGAVAVSSGGTGTAAVASGSGPGRTSSLNIQARNMSGDLSSGNEYGFAPPHLSPALAQGGALGNSGYQYRSGAGGNKTTSSLSASSVVETPPPTHAPLSLGYPLSMQIAQAGTQGQVQGQGQGHGKVPPPGQYGGAGGASGQGVPQGKAQYFNHNAHPKAASVVTNTLPISPNRFKNLPPLPPGSNRPSPSPDYDGEREQRGGDFGAGAGSEYESDTVRSRRGNAPTTPQMYSERSSQMNHYGPGPQPFDSPGRPRASFDPGENHRRPNVEPSPRLAQSMYAPLSTTREQLYPSSGMGMRGGMGMGGDTGSINSVNMGLPPRGFDGRAVRGHEYEYDYESGYEDGRGRGQEYEMRGQSGRYEYEPNSQTPGRKEGKRKGLKGLFGGSKAGRLA